MMPVFRPAAFALTVLLAACTTTDAPPMSDPISPSEPSAGACNHAAAQSMIGQPGTPANVERARVLAGARMAREIRHGMMVTMEFVEGRLNVYTDEKRVISQVRCG